jgi:hypothetical protein
MDFASPASQWQRGLWNTGVVLGLREVVQASEAQRDGALSGRALKWLAQSLRGPITDDPGVGVQQERKALSRLLEHDLSAGGANYHELRTWIDIVEPTYLGRWAVVLEGDDRPSREATARALVSALLDGGFFGAAGTRMARLGREHRRGRFARGCVQGRSLTRLGAT